jgi:hypothetical protein
MRRFACLALLLVLCAFSPHRFAGGSTTTAYQGVCDVIVGGCAVAYDVDRSPTSAYSGPLFQLWNGSSTLNVGQTTNHTVNLSTYAAFCGGSMTPATHSGIAVLVSSTCSYAGLYDAIQGSANTLIPITINTQYGPNCTGGGPYLCAAQFEIEVATGLPVFDTAVANNNGFFGDYYIAGDANAVGVNGGTSPVSLLDNREALPLQTCCSGGLMLSHLNSLDDDPADLYDFGPGIWYGTLVSSNNCGTPTTYCLAMNGGVTPPPPQDDYSTTQENVVEAAAWDTAAGGKPIHAYISGSYFKDYDSDGHTTTDTAIHLGGGGDLSQPSSVFFREGLITNTTMTATDMTNVQINTAAFFSTLTFPPPCVSC